MLEGLVYSGGHVARLSQANQGSIARSDGDFRFVPTLFHREHYLGLKFIAENLADFDQAGFNFLTNSGSDFEMPAGVFHVHERPSLGSCNFGDSITGIIWCQHSRREAGATTIIYCFTLRWWVLGMRISSRYFATVRRVTWMPCDCRMRVICSSVSGLAGSSSSISFFTRRFKMSNDVLPPWGPFTLSLKK